MNSAEDGILQGQEGVMFWDTGLLHNIRYFFNSRNEAK